MREINGKRVYTATKISQFLDISVPTLNSWYKWYNDPTFVKPIDTPYLPPYIQKSKMGIRYWDEDCLYYLRKFKDWLPRGRGGVMGDMNARSWGERGKRALKNKRKALEKK